ncbi:hypothetical protein [Streptomyces sp. NPDC090022]|uniref:hypothetical protein n=1 Tax=Streptomyces sp. NPDC090022 TaxID=3365920 RepID=UPI00381D05FE
MTASAVSLALLVTACGSDKPADKKDEPKAAGSAAAAPAAKGKTDAELAPVLIVQADLPDHVFKGATPQEAGAGATATTDKAECKPLVQAQSFSAIGTATGTARTKVAAKPKEPAADASPEDKLKAALGTTATAVTLASYDGKGAQEAFAAVKAAGTACAGGYTATQGAESGKISKVAAGEAVTAGDEALAYTIDTDADGEKITTQLVVVRKGNTLATFSSLSLSGTAEQPKAAVAAQTKKLG